MDVVSTFLSPCPLPLPACGVCRAWLAVMLPPRAGTPGGTLAPPCCALAGDAPPGRAFFGLTQALSLTLKDWPRADKECGNYWQ